MLFTVNDDFNFFLSVYIKTIEMTLYTTLSSHGLHEQVLRKKKKKQKQITAMDLLSILSHIQILK